MFLCITFSNRILQTQPPHRTRNPENKKEWTISHNFVSLYYQCLIKGSMKYYMIAVESKLIMSTTIDTYIHVYILRIVVCVWVPKASATHSVNWYPHQWNEQYLWASICPTFHSGRLSKCVAENVHTDHNCKQPHFFPIISLHKAQTLQ